MRWLAAVAVLVLAAGQAGAADVRNFSVRGSTGYQGTVRVSRLNTSETLTTYARVEWTFGAYSFAGYGVIAIDDRSLLTVSFLVPAGLGVGRYKEQPDGSWNGTLVGEKGFFVQEVWTSLDPPPPVAPVPAPATGGHDPDPSSSTGAHGAPAQE